MFPKNNELHHVFAALANEKHSWTMEKIRIGDVFETDQSGQFVAKILRDTAVRAERHSPTDHD